LFLESVEEKFMSTFLSNLHVNPVEVACFLLIATDFVRVIRDFYKGVECSWRTGVLVGRSA
jgi:hypothetical protein